MTLDLRDRPAVTLVGAGAIVLVTVVIVVLFAVVPYPDLPTVGEQPEPQLSTELAIVEYDEEPCIHVVDGRGERREVVCGADAEGFGLSWVDARTLEFRRHGFTLELVHIDVTTGALTVVSAEPEDAERPPEPASGTSGSTVNAEGDRVSTRGRDGVAVIEIRNVDGTERELLSVDGPRGYRFHDARWSGDGAWVVAQDTAGRVIVVSAGDDPAPRIWTEDVGEFAVR